MLDGHDQVDDDRTLLTACRQGDLRSCELVVRRYGPETLRAAWLLTGNQARASQLAQAAFMALFRELPRLDRSSSVREFVFRALGTAFLTPQPAPDASAVPVLQPLEGRATRYRVDDARSRTRDTLALLRPEARLALVLRELNGLDVEQISTLLGERVDITTTTLEASRRRLRNQIDLRPDETVRSALASAALDAPGGNLWPAIEDDVAAILRRAGNRTKIVSAVVLAVIVVVLVTALVMLLRDPGTDETDVSQARFVTDAVNDPPPFPTIAPARPTVTSVPTEAEVVPEPATVPDAMLMVMRASDIPDGLASLTQFRPLHSIKTQPVQQWARPNREEWPPLLSPDGSQLLLAHYETEGGATRVLVSAFDSQTFALLWQTELARVDAPAPGQKPDALVHLAVDAGNVYATLHFWREMDLVRLLTLDQDNGSLVTEWTVNIPGVAANDVRVVRPATGDRVYVFAITQGQPVRFGQMHIAFYGYELPDGREVHGKTLVDEETRRVFYMYSGQLTADGKSIYGLTYRDNSGLLAVQFFDLFTATSQPEVPVPFRYFGDREAVQEVVSHDGRWLYIFSPRSLEVAIIDLQARALLGIVPVDAELKGDPKRSGTTLGHTAMQLSPDGSRLYAIGASGVGTLRASGVWVIDTTTWQVVEHWLPETSPSAILLNGDGSRLYLHERTTPLGSPAHGLVRAVDTVTGEEVLKEELRFLPDDTEVQLQSLASIYRQQFGRSPNVGDTVPIDNHALTSLPGTQATLTPVAMDPGGTVTIDVRFVDPFTGEPLTEGQPNGRYQPPSGVRAILHQVEGTEADIILELGRQSWSAYSGVVTVPSPGTWTLSVVNTWPAPEPLTQHIPTPATLTVDPPPTGIGNGLLNIRR